MAERTTGGLFGAVSLTLVSGGALVLLLWGELDVPLFPACLVGIVYSLIHPFIGRAVVGIANSLCSVLWVVFEYNPDEDDWPMRGNSALIGGAIWPLTALSIPFLVVGIIFGWLYRQLFRNVTTNATGWTEMTPAVVQGIIVALESGSIYPASSAIRQIPTNARIPPELCRCLLTILTDSLDKKRFCNCTDRDTLNRLLNSVIWQLAKCHDQSAEVIPVLTRACERNDLQSQSLVTLKSLSPG